MIWAAWSDEVLTQRADALAPPGDGDRSGGRAGRSAREPGRPARARRPVRVAGSAAAAHPHGG